ncbi:ATP-binding protein [Candidatus Micrarchaeota archaeon]|nr:ATP-binding protein [Candidatus Micrarchaeota archaeon]
MINKEILIRVIREQKKELVTGVGEIDRDLRDSVSLNVGGTAIIIKGVRRSGKSTFAKQLLRKIVNLNYLNFDDDRIANFSVDDFQLLMEAFLLENGENTTSYLFDEIQNISGWELFINRLLRSNNLILITGSNADLLSVELGTHLTGRHVDFELFPFSFREFLSLKKPNFNQSDHISTSSRVALLEAFKEYLLSGGFPDVLKYTNPDLLAQLLGDIVQKDIIKRYQIRKPDELLTVIKFLIRNTARKITYSGVSKNFAIKSEKTIQKYLNYLQDTYLLFQVNKYEKKAKLFDKNPKKLYCIDNGLVLRYSDTAVQPLGVLLENFVAIELFRRGKKFYYYVNSDGTETDFVVVAQNSPKIELAIQVCLELTDIETRTREEGGLFKTLKANDLEEGLILTLDHEEEKVLAQRKIRYVPIWKWVLSEF